MWVLSSDGKSLADAEYFKVTKNLGGGKDKKWALAAFNRTTVQADLGGVVCAAFSEEEKAVAELERVVAFFEENPGKVYRFSDR